MSSRGRQAFSAQVARRRGVVAASSFLIVAASSFPIVAAAADRRRRQRAVGACPSPTGRSRSNTRPT
jgi:hypothetical protein